MTERLPKTLRRRAGADRIAAMEAATDAPESLRDRVGCAIWTDGLSPSIRRPWGELMETTRESYRRMADAAIAVICTPVDGAP